MTVQDYFITEPEIQSAWDTGLSGTIFKDCYQYQVVNICVEINYKEVCAELYLLGNKLADICAGWSRKGNELTADINMITLNSGIWKLERPKLHFVHALDTNDGYVAFTSKLYKLTVFEGYKEKERWDSQNILDW